MRRLLGMLRDDDEERSRAPQPSLERVDALAEEMRASGLPVELEVEGVPERDPARHRRLRLPDRAGGADERAQARRPGGRARRACVTRRTRSRSRSPTTAEAARPARARGNGLLGITRAGRRRRRRARRRAPPDGGFAVHARLPYRDDA